MFDRYLRAKDRLRRYRRCSAPRPDAERRHLDRLRGRHGECRRGTGGTRTAARVGPVAAQPSARSDWTARTPGRMVSQKRLRRAISTSRSTPWWQRAVPIGLVAPGIATRFTLSAVVLLASFYVNTASWMRLAAILERRREGVSATGPPPSRCRRGLLAAPTVVFYALPPAVSPQGLCRHDPAGVAVRCVCLARPGATSDPVQNRTLAENSSGGAGRAMRWVETPACPSSALTHALRRS